MTAIEIPTPDPRTFDDIARPFAEAISAHYAVKKMIGRGGMGVVYLARDRRLDRLVAIKTLPPHLAADATVRERFLRETRTAGAMSHPNIVPIHGADEIEGHVFFVMGFVDGDSLAAHVRGLGPLQPRVVARYLRDVAAALDHAHRRGIVHRDIKAENILIERSSGRALVTDFGIARLADAGPLTATGQLLGTVYYVSPEQVSGDSIDARSDIYSLGVVGYLALTGRFPFDAELASAVLVAHVTRPAPPLATINPTIPAALASVIERCLAKDPAARFATAEDLIGALDGAMADLDSPALVMRPRLISDTEAHAVWQRAAELQALTGLSPRPDPVARPRDAARDSARDEGFRLDDVRAAANEAGIADKYLEHVLVEHGLTPTRAPLPAAAEHPLPVQRRSIWAGVALDIVREVSIEGEVAPRDFDRLVNTLRDGTARLGTTTARSRELAWRCGWVGHRLEVSVVPDKGRTTVRLSQSVRRMAVGAMGASILGIAGIAAPATGAIVNELLALPAPSWGYALTSHAITAIAVASGAVVAIGSVPAARRILKWLRRQNTARLDALTEAVVGKVRESVGEK